MCGFICRNQKMQAARLQKNLFRGWFWSDLWLLLQDTFWKILANDTNYRYLHASLWVTIFNIPWHFSDHTNGGPVLFYNEYDLFYEFTNFYKFAPFEIDGKEWRSTEHYFQAQKFVGTPYEEYIRLHAATPREAFQFARDAESLKWQRSDWDHIKLSVMYKALLAKFTEHEQLRQLLLSTGDRGLVEHTFNDGFWGDGGDGSGLNHLGKLLEKVRGLLKETKYSKSQSGK